MTIRFKTLVEKKPFVLLWSEMTNTYSIITKTRRFRTMTRASRFIRRISRHESFVRVNGIYNLRGWSQLRCM